MKNKILNRIFKKVKVQVEPLSYVVIQEPDYCGGHRINFFGYTKKYRETAMEMAEEYEQKDFTYVLSFDAKEGDIYEEHYEPFHEEPRDVPVLIDSKSAMFILK